MASIAERTAHAKGSERSILPADEAARILGSGFPGKRVIGFCMIVAPIVAVISCLIGMGVYQAKGYDYVHAMGQHSALTSATFNLVVTVMVLSIFAVFGLSQLIVARRPGLGRLAGIITIVGLLGPIFFNGVYFGGFQLAGGSNEAAAGRAIDTAQRIPSVIMNISGPALVIGFILLGVAAYRSGVLRKGQAIALGITCLLPFGFISGYLAISAVGFLGFAIALVPLGVMLWNAPAAPQPAEV